LFYVEWSVQATGTRVYRLGGRQVLVLAPDAEGVLNHGVW
jgi:hypothetical protein